MESLESLARSVVRRVFHRESAIARSVRRDRLTYLSPEKIGRLERFSKKAMDRVEGSVVEFGVALGGSAIILATLARQRSAHFHGLDVFGMIPPPDQHDGPDVHARYETIRSGQSSGIDGDTYYGYRPDLLSDVRSAFVRHGLSLDEDILLHKGLFEETWPDIPDPVIAFAHVDCDWYDPVTFCLNALHPRVRAGSVILLDDYHDYSGCRKAVDEFLATRPDAYRVSDGPNLALERLGQG
jgi:O-methyltransferase